MDYPREKQVSYGNLGTASYDLSSKEWHFLRSPSTGTRLRVLEHDEIFPGLLAASGIPDSSSGLDHQVPARLRTHRINDLLQTNPELIPGSSMLPGLEQISAAVTELKQNYEPLAAKYIAHGTLGYEHHDQIPVRMRSRKVLASVTGTSRHVVRLSLVYEENRPARQGIENIELATDRYDSNHVAFWSGHDKTSILDLTFSKDDGNGSFLAARRHIGVDILQPIVRHSLSGKQQIEGAELGTGELMEPSYLDPNWILRISFDGSESIVISDFTFNPWNRTKCAILSISGEIKILAIQAPDRYRQTWAILLEAESSISNSEPKRDYNDGWGRLLWTVDQRSILIARRQYICAYSLLKDELVTSPWASDILPVGSFFLDVKHDGCNPNHFFILTSTSLVVLSCRASSYEKAAEEVKHDLQIEVSVLHYREMDDTSLQISVINNDRDTYLLLTSRISSLVTGFEISFDDATKLVTNVSDSFLFDIPKDLYIKNDSQQPEFSTQDRLISSLCMTAIERDLAGEETNMKDALGIAPRLLQILILNHSHGLFRIICAVEGSVPTSSSLVLVPSQNHTINPFAMNIGPRRKERFVVDSDESTEDIEVPSFPAFRYQSRNRSSKLKKIVNDFTFVATEINTRLRVSYELAQSMGSFESALEAILENRNEAQSGIHTLADFLSNSLPVDTIDVVASKISELLDKIRESAEEPSFSDGEALDIPQRIESTGLLSQHLINELQDSNKDDQLHLIQIYEKLLRMHLHSLSQSTPPGLKVWLENIIRQASMELYLASHGIQAFRAPNVPATEIDDDSPDEIVNSQHFKLAVRLRDNQQENIASTSQTLATKRQPTLSRPSSSASSHPSSSQQVTDSEVEDTKPIGSALAEYLNLRPTPPISRSMRRAIPEWQIGVQPTGHEWKSLSKSASQESLSIHQHNRKRKRDKGKYRANESMEDKTLYYNAGPNPPTTGQPDSVPLARHDLHVEPLTSRSFSRSSLPVSSQHSEAVFPSSQPMSVLSSQIGPPGSASQSKTVRSKKRSAIRKRPSGFR